MKKIEAILFDFGGTLDNNGSDWFTRIYAGIAARTDGRIPLEIFQTYARQAADEMALLPDTCKLDMDQTARRLCRNTHEKMKHHPHLPDWNPDDVADAFIADAHAQVHANRPALEQLRQTYRLGCISNNWGNIAGWCRQFDLHLLFETMIDSTIVGAVKPEPKIFQAALDELNLPPHACAYVGDKYECDILGARAAGFTPVWIANGQIPPAPDHQPVTPLRINCIPDLLSLNWI